MTDKYVTVETLQTRQHTTSHTHKRAHTCIAILVMASPVIIVICQKHTLIYGQIKNTQEKKLRVPATAATQGD